MKRLLESLYRPSNSLVLVYDHLTADSQAEFEAQIEEIGHYYKFSTLSEIMRAPAKSNVMGRAAIALSSARKSIFLRGVPHLLRENIPFTLFLSSDCIGLNRLPPEEEMALYEEHYPQSREYPSWKSLRDACANGKSDLDSGLIGLRSAIGPLPLDKIDPTLFFTTWGKIREVPPRLVELGIRLSRREQHVAIGQDSLNFIRRQTGTDPQFAFSPEEGMWDAAHLAKLGLKGLLTLKSGAVEKSTNTWAIPRWNLIETER